MCRAPIPIRCRRPSRRPKLGSIGFPDCLVGRERAFRWPQSPCNPFVDAYCQERAFSSTKNHQFPNTNWRKPFFICRILTCSPDAGHQFLWLEQTPNPNSVEKEFHELRTSRSHRDSDWIPTPSLTQSGALPTGVTFIDNGNGTATLSRAPAANTNGTYPLTITGANGVGTPATQKFTLTVDQSPAFTSA